MCEMFRANGKDLHVNIENQFCYPPPKPPRRRHSEQLPAYRKSTVLIERKCHNGSLFETTQPKNITHGYESLPLNLSTRFNSDTFTGDISSNLMLNFVSKKEFSGIQSDMPSKTFSNLEDSSSFSKQSLFSKQHNVQVTVSNSISTSEESSFFIEEPSTFSSPDLNINEPLISSSSSTERNVDFTRSLMPSEDMLEVCITKNNQNLVSCDSDSPKIFHRRYHSDPECSDQNSYLNTSNCTTLGNRVSDSSINKYAKSTHSFTNTETLFLSTEIKCLKDTNDVLWQQLILLQEKLDNLQKNQNSVQGDFPMPTVTELLCNIYKAEKEKDIAIDGRFQFIEAERDAAVNTLESVFQSLSSFEECDFNEETTGISDKELENIFLEMEFSKSPSHLLQQHRALLAYIYHSKNIKVQEFSHRLKICEEEKKQANEKVEKLEEELLKLKSSKCLSHHDVKHSDLKHWEANLLDALCEVISQRDSAYEKIENLREHIKLLEGHHKSNDLLKPIPAEMCDSDAYNKNTYGQSSKCNEDKNDENYACNYESLAEQTKQLKSKVSYLTKHLDYEIKRRQTAEENCHKLDQLVISLRKKINRNNVGVPV